MGVGLLFVIIKCVHFGLGDPKNLGCALFYFKNDLNDSFNDLKQC